MFSCLRSLLIAEIKKNVLLLSITAWFLLVQESCAVTSSHFKHICFLKYWQNILLKVNYFFLTQQLCRRSVSWFHLQAQQVTITWAGTGERDRGAILFIYLFHVISSLLTCVAILEPASNNKIVVVRVTHIHSKFIHTYALIPHQSRNHTIT